MESESSEPKQQLAIFPEKIEGTKKGLTDGSKTDTTLKSSSKVSKLAANLANLNLSGPPSSTPARLNHNLANDPKKLSKMSLVSKLASPDLANVFSEKGTTGGASISARKDGLGKIAALKSGFGAPASASSRPKVAAKTVDNEEAQLVSAAASDLPNVYTRVAVGSAGSSSSQRRRPTILPDFVEYRCDPNFELTKD